MSYGPNLLYTQDGNVHKQCSQSFRLQSSGGKYENSTVSGRLGKHKEKDVEENKLNNVILMTVYKQSVLELACSSS